MTDTLAEPRGPVHEHRAAFHAAPGTFIIATCQVTLPVCNAHLDPGPNTGSSTPRP